MNILKCMEGILDIYYQGKGKGEFLYRPVSDVIMHSNKMTGP